MSATLGRADTELLYARLLLNAAARHADVEQFIDDDGRDRLGDHVVRTLRLSSALRDEFDVGPDDRIAVLAPNSRHYANLWHVGLVGGAVTVPLNTRLAVPELIDVVQDAAPTTLFVDAPYDGVVPELVARSSSIRHVVAMAKPFDGATTTLEGLVAAGREEIPGERAETDPTMIIYTGGTTGRPKGVVLSQRAQALQVYHSAMTLDCWRRGSVGYQLTGMFHMTGAAGTACFPIGGSPVVIRSGFDAARALDDIEQHQVTHLNLVPTMIDMLLSHPTFSSERFASVRRITYGAAPIQPRVLELLLERAAGAEVQQSYGMTEVFGTVTLLTHDDHVAGGDRLRSVGRPVPWADVSVRDDGGGEVPDGVPGELWLRCGSVMSGYHSDPAATDAALAGDWYHTGDIGCRDVDGFIHLVDRAKDMIVSGGENVYSVEVEHAILTLAGVAQCAVIGIPHDRWGEAVHAIVVPSAGVEIDEHELRRHVAARVADYKVPKTFELRTSPLPLSGTMKVLKDELRRPYWVGRERAIS